MADSLALRNHLLFKSTLINWKGLVTKYSELKLALTGNQGITIQEYTKKKTDCIISVLFIAGLEEPELIEIKNANI
jgi:hypothetical protein